MYRLAHRPMRSSNLAPLFGVLPINWVWLLGFPTPVT